MANVLPQLRGAVFALAVLMFGPATAKAPIDYVDPFIGTEGEGSVYPGATLPFGFVQVSPDTADSYASGGYRHSKNIDGFSQQHISGMGGPLYGHVSLMPMTGPLVDPSAIVSSGKADEGASPGYYTVRLAPWNVKVELTATRHVGYHRHHFAAGGEMQRVLVDAGHVLYGTGEGWGSARPIGGEVRIDPATQEVSGFMRYRGGRSARPTWTVHFAARFDTPFRTFGTWDDKAALSDGALRVEGSEVGAYLDFGSRAGTQVTSKIAVSYHSVEQARGYLAQTPGFDFEAVHAAARAEWAEALGRIVVEGGTEDQRTQFYTALYRLHVTPNDWTGEAPPRYGRQTYYENILCLWDTFRTVNPLLTLIQPQVQRDIVNTLIAYHRTDGWTGDAHSAWVYEHVQNGSNADVVIADAYAKRLPGIDWQKAYEAIRKNAFVDDNPLIEGRPVKGRFRLDDYRRLGYVPTDATERYAAVQAVSRTLEYAYNDHAVHLLARRFGSKADVAELARRRFNYRNVWDPSVRFMRGRLKDGSWYTPFQSGPPLDKDKDVNQLTNRQYYEGLPSTWSWYAPHDTQGLINLLGGNQAFVDRLATAVENYYEAYNEPGMLQTYLFIHAGRPDLTQHYVRKALSNFNSSPAGLPGNDDSGTTSAWLVWSMLGLYPNAGQDYYYVGSPVFTKATVTLGNGKRIVITAPQAAADSRYITSARLNGRPLARAWLRHRELIDGAYLDVKMAASASRWGAGSPPPSLSAAVERRRNPVTASQLRNRAR